MTKFSEMEELWNSCCPNYRKNANYVSVIHAIGADAGALHPAVRLAGNRQVDVDPDAIPVPADVGRADIRVAATRRRSSTRFAVAWSDRNNRGHHLPMIVAGFTGVPLRRISKYSLRVAGLPGPMSHILPPPATLLPSATAGSTLMLYADR